MNIKLPNRHLLYVLTASCILVHFNSASLAQSTWQKVYTIFQSIGTIDNVDFVATPMANAYTSIVDQPTDNTFAQSKGYKRIDPGYPHRSYFFRKINDGLDMDIVLDTAEGGIVGTLTDYEKELVRQWIQYGAPQTGDVVDTSLIYTYYTVGGIDGSPTPLPAPAPADGFQLHFGKIFLPPSSEIEIFLKHDPKLTQDVEINRIEAAMAGQSHHMVMYKFYTGLQNNYPDGLRFGDSLRSHGDADIVSAFQNSTDLILPTGTAYRWLSTDVLDFNYHIVNTDTSVLAVDAYFNIYTQPIGTASSYMFSSFFPNFNIVIPQDTSVYTFTEVANDPNPFNMNFWNIWILYSHTHKYGLDYDIWLRNPDGSKGSQVYEGFMNFDYTADIGYYDYEQTPQRIFDSVLLVVDPRDGFIHEAIFKNTGGPDPIAWGLTAEDEMMVMGFQYTIGAPLTSVNDNLTQKNIDLKIYPNPFSTSATLKINSGFTLTGNEELIIYDLYGKEVRRIVNIKSREVKIERKFLPGGMYFYTLNSFNGILGRGKLLIE